MCNDISPDTLVLPCKYLKYNGFFFHCGRKFAKHAFCIYCLDKLLVLCFSISRDFVFSLKIINDRNPKFSMGIKLHTTDF